MILLLLIDILGWVSFLGACLAPPLTIAFCQADGYFTKTLYRLLIVVFVSLGYLLFWIEVFW